MVVRLAVNQTVAGSSPAGTARYGRASQLARWHPVGSRARRKPLQVRVLSLPLAKDVLPREQPAEGADVRAVAERPGNRLIRGSEAGSTPAGPTGMVPWRGLAGLFDCCQ